jgi:hypothetical protein
VSSDSQFGIRLKITLAKGKAIDIIRQVLKEHTVTSEDATKGGTGS